MAFRDEQLGNKLARTQVQASLDVHDTHASYHITGMQVHYLVAWGRALEQQQGLWVYTHPVIDIQIKKLSQERASKPCLN